MSNEQPLVADYSFGTELSYFPSGLAQLCRNRLVALVTNAVAEPQK